MNRRQFLLSAFALGVGQNIQASGYGATAFGRQAPAQPAAPPVTSFEDLRRGVGMFIGNGGTIGYLVNGDGAIAIDSQFMNTAAIVRRRPQAARAEGHRAADQHAPSRRPHRRQPGVPRRSSSASSCQENCLGVAQEGRRAGQERRPTRRLPTPPSASSWSRELRRREGVGALLRRRAYQRRRGDPLREGQRRARGRPAVQPRASAHRRPAGALGGELDQGARQGRQGARATTRSSSSATARTTTRRHQGRRDVLPRLPVGRASITAARASRPGSRRTRSARSTALKGFESVDRVQPAPHARQHARHRFTTNLSKK